MKKVLYSVLLFNCICITESVGLTKLFWHRRSQLRNPKLNLSQWEVEVVFRCYQMNAQSKYFGNYTIWLFKYPLPRDQQLGGGSDPSTLKAAVAFD